MTMAISSRKAKKGSRINGFNRFHLGILVMRSENPGYKADGTSFLILSDLHFTDIEGKHAFSIADDKVNLSLEQVIFDKLKGKKLSGIIIAGDFTWCASEQEFSFAERFIL